MSIFVPNFGSVLLVPAASRRARRHARYDRAVSRRIVEGLGLEWHEPVNRYNHVMMPTTVIEPVNGTPTITVSEFSEHIGCHRRRLMPGEGPFDVYDWIEGPASIEQRQTIRRWWWAHYGEGYGYFKYMRMLWRALVGCRDWTKLVLIVGGFVCSSGWATASQKANRRLFNRLNASIITPMLIACCPRMTLVKENWRVP